VGLRAMGFEKKKLLPPPGFESQTVQPILSHYTDYGIPVNLKHYGLYNI
jgi:hypothetical protein